MSHESELEFFGCIEKTNHKKGTLLKDLYFNQLVSMESGLVRFWQDFFNDTKLLGTAVISCGRAD